MQNETQRIWEAHLRLGGDPCELPLCPRGDGTYHTEAFSAMVYKAWAEKLLADAVRADGGFSYVMPRVVETLVMLESRLTTADMFGVQATLRNMSVTVRYRSMVLRAWFPEGRGNK